MSRPDKLVERVHYTYSTRPRRLADLRSIHAGRVVLRQAAKRAIKRAISGEPFCI